MENDFILPERLKHPKVLREDMQVIDHVSYLLSRPSIDTLGRLLARLAISSHLSGYTKDSDPIPTVAVTITYSKNRLNLYPFKYAKLDMDTIYTELSNEESIYLYPNKQEIRFDVIQDINGNWVEVMLIEGRVKDIFIKQHKKFLEKFNGEWSQGEYLPYIKLGNVDSPTNRGYLRSKNEELPDRTLDGGHLMFNCVRYMRFSERIIR